MKIICNGKEMDVQEDLTIEKLVLGLELNPATVVVECDSAIVLPDSYAAQKLSEGSVVELIRFVGGG